jgi:hypothetical protein
MGLGPFGIVAQTACQPEIRFIIGAASGTRKQMLNLKWA